jgi:chromosome segregation ATPase
VVVFVNKDEHWKATADTAKTQYEKERMARNEARQQADALNSQLQLVASEANNRAQALRKDISDRDAQILDLKNQVAKVDQEKKAAEVAMQNMSKVQEGLQGQLAAAHAEVAAIRKIRDDLVAERFQLNTQLTDALAKVDALDRARKNAEERAAGARAELDTLQGKVRDAGFSLNTLPNRTNTGAPELEGVITHVFNAGGKPWASISLGSRQNVTKDMKFNVVNNNEFLGYLTIVTADTDESAGVLEGPKVDKVRERDEVKTQLK